MTPSPPGSAGSSRRWAKVERTLLSGHQLGHALHPMLTDLPIGFWTTSFVLDLVGGSAGRDISRRCIALGLATVPATALAGWSDWSAATASSTDETLMADSHKEVTDPAAIRRVGVAHAVLNGSATLAYAASWLARRRGKQATGVAWGLIGATAATAAGHLGGHLVFRLGTGVEPRISSLAGAPEAAASTGSTDGADGSLTIPDRATASATGSRPEESSFDSADTPLLEVIGDLERQGFEGQFRSAPGATIECLTCRRSFGAADAGALGATRLEGESDPADMLLVVAVHCPNCGASGTLILSYGPDATAEDSDVVLTLDRPAGEGRHTRA